MYCNAPPTLASQLVMRDFAAYCEGRLLIKKFLRMYFLLASLRVRWYR